MELKSFVSLDIQYFISEMLLPASCFTEDTTPDTITQNKHYSKARSDCLIQYLDLKCIRHMAYSTSGSVNICGVISPWHFMTT